MARPGGLVSLLVVVWLDATHEIDVVGPLEDTDKPSQQY